MGPRIHGSLLIRISSSEPAPPLAIQCPLARARAPPRSVCPAFYVCFVFVVVVTVRSLLLVGRRCTMVYVPYKCGNNAMSATLVDAVDRHNRAVNKTTLVLIQASHAPADAWPQNLGGRHCFPGRSMDIRMQCGRTFRFAILRDPVTRFMSGFREWLFRITSKDFKPNAFERRYDNTKGVLSVAEVSQYFDSIMAQVNRPDFTDFKYPANHMTLQVNSISTDMADFFGSLENITADFPKAIQLSNLSDLFVGTRAELRHDIGQHETSDDPQQTVASLKSILRASPQRREFLCSFLEPDYDAYGSRLGWPSCMGALEII